MEGGGVHNAFCLASVSPFSKEGDKGRGELAVHCVCLAYY